MSAELLAVVREPTELGIVSTQLRKAGIEVTGASTLLEAALRQVDSPANVIVCDADDVDWRAALDTLRPLPGTADIIFLTGCGDERIWLDMLDAGACDLLQKPYQPEDLRWVVCTALKRRRAAAQCRII